MMTVKSIFSIKFGTLIILFTLLVNNLFAQVTPRIGQRPMDEFIGACAFIDDPLTAMEALGPIREYHIASWDPGGLTDTPYPNEEYALQPSRSGGGWMFDDYYQNVGNAGHFVFPSLWKSPSWLNNDEESIPVSSGDDKSDPMSYGYRGSYLYQYAARYGSNQNVPLNTLKLKSDNDPLVGLGLLTYLQNWNEPNTWWHESGNFTPQELAAMSSADYDGHEGALGTGHGMINADPNMKFVTGCTAGINVDYYQQMQTWFQQNRSDQKFLFDVVSMNKYLGTESPEDAGLHNMLVSAASWVHGLGADKEFWLTEIGWDTNQGSSQRAPTYAGFDAQEVQGQYMVRTYLISAGANVDMLTMFMLRDVVPSDPTQYQSCGLVGPKGDWTPKKSWYYTYATRMALEGMYFKEEVNSGNSDVIIYKFSTETGDQNAYAVWSGTADGSTQNNFTVNIAESVSDATLIELANNETHGISTTLTVSGGNVTVDVSERPIFIIVGEEQAVIEGPVVTNPSPMCSDGIQALTTTGINVKWYADINGGVILGTGTSFTPTFFQSKNIYVTHEVGGIESEPTTVYVQIDAQPVIQQNVAILIVEFIDGDSPNLEWFLNGVTTSQVGANYNTNGVEGTYTLTATRNGHICTSDPFVVGNLSTDPPVLVSNPGPICPNVSGIIQVVGENVKWFSDAGLTQFIYAGETYPLNSGSGITQTTTFYATQTVGSLESDALAIVVELADSPVPVISVNGTSLTTTSYASYQWSMDGGSITNATAQSFTPIAEGAHNYTVAITTTGGCVGTSGTYSYTVEVQQTQSNPPSVSDPNPSYCQGETMVAITASGVNVRWYADAGLTSLITTGNSYAPTVAGAIYVTQTEAGKTESNASTVTIVINALPVVTIVESGTSLIGPANMSSYSWTYNSNVIGTSQTQASQGDGSYTLTVISTTDCSSSAVYQVSSVAAPIVSNSVSVVENVATTLTVTGDAGATFIWYDDALLSNGIASGTSYSPSTATVGETTYYVTQTVGGEMGPAANVTVTVTAAQAATAPTVSPANPTFDSDAISALTASGELGATFTWYSDINLGTVVGIGASFTPAITSTTSFYVTQTLGGTASTATTVLVTINEVNLEVTVTRVGNILVSTAGDTYQWSLNGTEISGATLRTYEATQNGIYTVTVIAGSQTDVSDPLLVDDLSGPTAVENIQLVEVSVYPNPTDDGYIVIEVLGAGSQIVVCVYNQTGALILSDENKVTTNRYMQVLDLSMAPAGIYAVKVISENGSVLTKVVKR